MHGEGIGDMVEFKFKLGLKATFTAFKADTVRWEDGQIVEGEVLWEKGKNSCVILEESYQTRLWQIMGFGTGFINDHSGYAGHLGNRAQPFKHMQLGDGTFESLDASFPDLVHPCDRNDVPYDYSRPYKGPMYQHGSWRLCDKCDINDYDADTSAVYITQLYHFGTEHCNDRLITEWGIFATVKHEWADSSTWIAFPIGHWEYHWVRQNYRRFLNRNHLDPIEQFWKHSNMILRAEVRIWLGM